MSNAYFQVPVAKNEPVLSYAPGSPEKATLKAMLKTLKSKAIEVPMTIGGKKIMGEGKIAMHPPHELTHTLGWHGKADATLVSQAIEAALAAK